MNEKLLQFIWQYSLYHPVGLCTTDGEPVTVVHPGRLNTNAGPDFEEAKIKVADTILVGKVELHVRTSDWKKHGHSRDKAYRNIIMHVVYEDDAPDEFREHFPTMALVRHIPPYVIDQYTHLLHASHSIPCSSKVRRLNELVKESWLNRLLAERWEQKLKEWKALLDRSAGDWRSLLYWRLAANFGFKVNETPFLMLAQSLPVNILTRHKDNLFQIEALLFGQAGLLSGRHSEDYPLALLAEYEFLREKYSLQPISGHLWKLLRMRPANFPTVRIAEFAVLIHRSLHLFAHIIEAATVKEILPLLNVTASSYWNNHYHFDEVQQKQLPKKLGTSSIHNIIINTIAPIQFLYAHHHGNARRQEQSLSLLASVPAERNSIIQLWEEHGWIPLHAAHTQPLLQLYNQYCSRKRCLECAIGLGIVRSRPVE